MGIIDTFLCHLGDFINYGTIIISVIVIVLGIWTGELGGQGLKFVGLLVLWIGVSIALGHLLSRFLPASSELLTGCCAAAFYLAAVILQRGREEKRRQAEHIASLEQEKETLLRQVETYRQQRDDLTAQIQNDISE